MEVYLGMYLVRYEGAEIWGIYDTLELAHARLDGERKMHIVKGKRVPYEWEWNDNAEGWVVPSKSRYGGSMVIRPMKVESSDAQT